MHLPIRCQSHTLVRQVEAERAMQLFELISLPKKLFRKLYGMIWNNKDSEIAAN